MIKSPYSWRPVDNAVMHNNKILFHERSKKQAAATTNILTDAYASGMEDGVTNACMYGDAYLSTVAEDCGMSMAKFMAILCKHGVALAKK